MKFATNQWVLTAVVIIVAILAWQKWGNKLGGAAATVPATTEGA